MQPLLQQDAFWLIPPQILYLNNLDQAATGLRSGCGSKRCCQIYLEYFKLEGNCRVEWYGQYFCRYRNDYFQGD